MKIIFLGSPESVLGPLKFLDQLKESSDGKHELIGVISQPAKKAGRGKKLLDPPIAVFARENGIHLMQPPKASESEFLDQLKLLKPDLMITAAYGQILSDEFLAIPSRGTINIHPSILPKYRGATPVPAALMAGDEITGVTILFTVKKLDAGNIICQEQYQISPDETADILTTRLFDLGTKILPKAIDLLQDDSFSGETQSESLITHCKKIAKEQGLIEWSKSSDDILNNFRGLYPWPGCYTFQGEKRIGIEVISKFDLESDLDNKTPGSFSFIKSEKGIVVKTGNGKLILKKLKPEGSKSQDAASFWNGQKIKEGLSFEQKS